MTYLTSTNETAIINAELKISENCNLPNDSGTLRWDAVTKSYSSDLWFIAKPSLEGWRNEEGLYTYEQMMADVDLTDIVDAPRNDDWFPPPITPPGG